MGSALLMPTLRVLSTHAHLVGLEYFEDLTAAFGKLLRSPVLSTGQRLEVVLAVSQVGVPCACQSCVSFSYWRRVLAVVLRLGSLTHFADGNLEKGAACGILNAQSTVVVYTEVVRHDMIVVVACESLQNNRSTKEYEPFRTLLLAPSYPPHADPQAAVGLAQGGPARLHGRTLRASSAVVRRATARIAPSRGVG